MMKQQGKINFTGLIMLLIIIYGGYAAVKLIITGTTNTQIKKETIDTLGIMRGADFDEREGEEAVRNILQKHSDNITVEETEENPAVWVKLNREKGTITFHYTYDIETNLLFFKTKKNVAVTESVQSYD